MQKYRSSTWFDPRLSLRSSTIHGKGLFASERIGAGEIVMIWGGILYTRQDLQDIRAGKIKVKEFSYSFIDEDLLLAGPDDGLDYFVNHSCDPSVWMLDDVTVVARRDIEIDEEITGDYAVWESEPNYRIEACLCGSDSCRKHISGNDWQRPDLQERYQGHFLPYISRKIERLKRET